MMCSNSTGLGACTVLLAFLHLQPTVAAAIFPDENVDCN